MPVTLADIEAAQRRLVDAAVRTPLIENDELNRVAAGRVLLKPECWQRTGSFKIRGAYNMLSQLSAEQAARGVVAFSSGNHAQGVAAAGKLLGIRTTIVMPEDAPRSKLDNTRRLGGEIVTYDRYTGDREAIAREIAAERGTAVVPSFDHPHIIAGQGTVGLEIALELRDLGVEPDQVLICCGGGGLSSGSAVALRGHHPGVSIHTVEPVDFDDTARSLEEGRRVGNDPAARSICDALLTEMPGEKTFHILSEFAAAGLAVSDDEAREAMRFAFRHLKMVIEPGGAVALAAVLTGKLQTRDRTTVAVISGGNVDPDFFAEVLAA